MKDKVKVTLVNKKKGRMGGSRDGWIDGWMD